MNKKDINWDELADLSGETSLRAVKYVVPILKFNGNTGKFTYLIQDSEGKFVPQPAEAEPEIVILKVRRVATAFEKTRTGAVSYFTNEHNSWKDELVLFESTKGGSRPRVIDTGLIKDLRLRWPNLRLRNILYVLRKNEVVKLGVRGKSLSAFVNYYKSFPPSEHLAQFVTKLEQHSETNEGGKTYFVLDFVKKDKSDWEEVAERIKEVAGRLKLQDQSYQELPKIEEEVEPSPEKSEQEPETEEEPESSDI